MNSEEPTRVNLSAYRVPIYLILVLRYRHTIRARIRDPRQKHDFCALRAGTPGGASDPRCGYFSPPHPRLDADADRGQGRGSPRWACGSAAPHPRLDRVARIRRMPRPQARSSRSDPQYPSSADSIGDCPKHRHTAPAQGRLPRLAVNVDATGQSI